MSILKKLKRKDYKELYEIEVNNRKMFEKRYNEKKKENIELQKSTGIADLRKVINELSNKVFELEKRVSFLRKDRAELYVQLEDLRIEKEMYKYRRYKTIEKNKKDKELNKDGK